MAKIILGKTPESFKGKAHFPMLDGSEGVIACEFKYRTKTEFGAFVDAISKDAGFAPEAGKPFLLAELLGKTVDKNADYLMDVLKGWDVDAELCRDACAQLANEVPAAAVAIVEAYRAAVVDGRLGN